MTSRALCRSAVRAAALVMLAAGLGACAELPTGVEPVESSVTVVAAARLTGSYEAAGPVVLASGATLYKVGVYFGTEQNTPEPLYIVQVGVRQGGDAKLTLYQDRYTVSGAEVAFAGSVLSGAAMRDGVLEVTVAASGERVALRLQRSVSTGP